MFSIDTSSGQPSQMLLLGKVLAASGVCLLAVAGFGAAGVAHGLNSEALLWSTLAGCAGLVGGAVLAGFGVLEQRLLAQAAQLQALRQSTEAAPAVAPLETPAPFRSRPAAVGQRRLKLI